MHGGPESSTPTHGHPLAERAITLAVGGGYTDLAGKTSIAMHKRGFEAGEPSSTPQKTMTFFHEDWRNHVMAFVRDKLSDSAATVTLDP